MKKQILSIGKILKNTELKNIVGGVDLRDRDEYCDNLTETQYDPNCPCFTNTQCINMSVMTDDGPRFRSGTCVGGICVAPQ